MLHGFFERQAAAGKTFDRILYVGDGKGDFCPSSLLLHGHRHWHPEAAGAGVDAAPSAVAAPGAGAAADGGAGGSGGAPAPCGNGANIVFARNEYPDGLPCSLFVMLSQAGDAPAGDGGRQAATGQRGVLPWSRPEQLAALLRQELGL